MSSCSVYDTSTSDLSSLSLHDALPISDQPCGPLLDVSADDVEDQVDAADVFQGVVVEVDELLRAEVKRLLAVGGAPGDRKSTRLNSSHPSISYAVFCLKKKIAI